MTDLRFDPNCPPPLEGISMAAEPATPNLASRLSKWLWDRELHWLSWKVADAYFAWRDFKKWFSPVKSEQVQ